MDEKNTEALNQGMGEQGTAKENAFVMEEHTFITEEKPSGWSSAEVPLVVEKESEQGESAGESAEEQKKKSKIDDIIEDLKELVKKGGVTRIRIRKDDTVVLNIPVNVGVVGTILGAAMAPWALILVTITTIGLSCAVEVEKEDGSVSVVYGK